MPHIANTNRHYFPLEQNTVNYLYGDSIHKPIVILSLQVFANLGHSVSVSGEDDNDVRQQEVSFFSLSVHL